MFVVTVQTRQKLTERADRARGWNYNETIDQTLVQDRIVPKGALYFAFVLDEEDNFDLAETIFLGLEHRTARTMTKQTFDHFSDIGLTFNPRFVGKKIALYSI